MTSANKKGSSGEVVFNIFRDVGEGNFLNRICKDEGTDEIKYFGQVDKELRLKVHKGDKSGRVIASAKASLDKNGVTLMELTESGQIVGLQHVHGFFSGKTFLEVGGKKVHWKGQSALVEEDSGVCLAVYKAKRFEAKSRKLGTLLVTKHGAEFVDIIVSSALVEQERSDQDENEQLSLSQEGGGQLFYKGTLPFS